MRRYEHVEGVARTQLRDKIAEQYNAGTPMRQIARDLGRSYGFVHRLLHEHPDVVVRRRGAPKGRRPSRISDSLPVITFTAPTTEETEASHD